MAFIPTSNPMMRTLSEAGGALATGASQGLQKGLDILAQNKVRQNVFNTLVQSGMHPNQARAASLMDTKGLSQLFHEYGLPNQPKQGGQGGQGGLGNLNDTLRAGAEAGGSFVGNEQTQGQDLGQQPLQGGQFAGRAEQMALQNAARFQQEQRMLQEKNRLQQERDATLHGYRLNEQENQYAGKGKSEANQLKLMQAHEKEQERIRNKVDKTIAEDEDDVDKSMPLYKDVKEALRILKSGKAITGVGAWGLSLPGKLPVVGGLFGNNLAFAGNETQRLNQLLNSIVGEKAAAYGKGRGVTMGTQALAQSSKAAAWMDPQVSTDILNDIQERMEPMFLKTAVRRQLREAYGDALPHNFETQVNKRIKSMSLIEKKAAVDELINAELPFSQQKQQLPPEQIQQIAQTMAQMFPPAQFKGKQKRHKASGVVLESDGNAWLPTQGAQ